MTMTDERLAELEALCAKATEGPWEVDSGDVYCLDRDICRAVAEMPRCHPTGEVFENDPNAAFIAASREAVPALVAEVRRLRAERAKLEKMVNWLTKWLGNNMGYPYFCDEDNLEKAIAVWREAAEKAVSKAEKAVANE